jgi:nitroimidazol reductase NimA-like FMN-containing flavoprotein (pyridoxamine 5'-phosphate oxidase superfamily)
MSRNQPVLVAPLNRDECLALLASVPVGRVAITDRAMPAILPVNFLLDGSDVIIRSVSGSKLAAATRSAVVAFEADAYDATQRTGWSVLIVGVAGHVTDPAEVNRLSRLGLQPYIDGAASHYIRIPATQISGRRLVTSTAALAREC